MDSISQLLETEQRPLERMDLLLGLTRAKVFAEGPSNALPYAQETLRFASNIGDKAGESAALLMLYQCEVDLEKIGLDRVLPALKLAEAEQNPSLEIMAIYHLIEYYIVDNTDLPNARKWIDEGRSRLRPSVSPKQRGNFYKNVGVYHKILGNIDSSYYWQEQALLQFEQVGDYLDPNLGRQPATHWDNGDLNVAHAELNLAVEDANLGQYERAERRLRRALQIGNDWGATLTVGWALTELGYLNAVLGDLPTAIHYNSEALQLFEAKGIYLDIVVAAEQIGILFLSLNDPVIAEKYFNKAYDAAMVNHDTIELISVGVLKSTAARRQGHFTTAWKHARKGLAMGERSGDPIGIGTSLLEFGHIATAEGSPELGLVNYEKAAQVLGSTAETHETLHNYLGRSRAFLMLNQADSAQFYVLAAEEVAQKSITLADKLPLLLQAAEVAAAKNDYVLAFDYQKQYKVTSDSLRKQAAISSLQRERTRQNVVDFQRQKESAEREAALLVQRNQLYLALGATMIALLLVGVFLFLRLRTAREKLAERNENLRHLNATKDRFFGIIAHDLRNPVVALNMAGEQLGYSLSQGAQEVAVRQAKNINRTVNRLSGLLDNLLQWALLQTGNAPYQPENLHLAALTEEAVDLYEQAAELKQIELTKDIPQNLIIKADSRALLSVIRNLVNNALKFTPSGGKVTLTARSIGREIILEIKDSGIGISPLQQEKLFDISVTSLPGTAGERGSGLGLLLCQELVEQNGGKISLVSKEGIGSIFTIYLPAADHFIDNKPDLERQKVAGLLS